MVSSLAASLTILIVRADAPSPAVFSTYDEMASDFQGDLRLVPVLKQRDLLEKQGYSEVVHQDSGRTLFLSRKLYPKESMARYLAGIANLKDCIRPVGTLDLSNKETGDWLRGILHAVLGNVEAGESTPLALRGEGSIQFSDGVRTINVDVSPNREVDRAKLTATPLKVAQKGSKKQVEDFLGRPLGSGFRCFVLSLKSPRAGEQLSALQEASAYLAERYEEFEIEEKKLRTKLYETLKQLGLASPLDGVSKGMSMSNIPGDLKGRTDQWVRNYKSYGFFAENEARIFLGRAKVDGTREGLLVSGGSPSGGNGTIGFDL